MIVPVLLTMRARMPWRGREPRGVNCAEKNAVLQENAQGKLALSFQVQPLMWYRLVAILALVEAS